MDRMTRLRVRLLTEPGLYAARNVLARSMQSSSFDTYKFVQRLEADGFKREEAEAIMNSLAEVVNESTANITKDSMSKAEFEKSLYVNRVDFNHVRADIQLLEKNDFALLKADAARASQEVDRLRLRLAEELRRVKSNVRLELGVEKGRVRDLQGANELRIREAEARIESEVAGIRTQLETVQWELIKTLFPLFCAAGALAFSYLRFIA